ncbi:Shikimate O-hydroxycinnamoyltransferase [Arachis hypogaea]|nr:Shikimate O-hydroxycinnamoyltransferase [Arachis hypogaea]
MELIEKVVVYPEQSTLKKRIFLSNIDLCLVVYQDTVFFFDPPTSEMSFSEIFNKLCNAFGKLLVHYDFMAGRLVQSLEDSHRFEIDCNDAGIVVIAARTDRKLSEFGDIFAPNQDLEELAMFLQGKQEEEIDLKEKPLLSVQLTQFACGSLALTAHYNHCTLDGLAVRDFGANLAALTRGDSLIVVPFTDRTLLRARNPPRISYPHFEYGKATNIENLFSVRGTSGGINVRQNVTQNQIQILYLSPQQIASFKMKAIKDCNLKNVTTFHVVAGNALVPGFARATVKELTELEDAYHIIKVQEGIERLDDEYIKSSIDWLELNKGVPRREDSFSLVSGLRLGIGDQHFAWGKLKCSTPLTVKPGLVMLLPAAPGDGGLNVCLDLLEDQMYIFRRIMLEF